MDPLGGLAKPMEPFSEKGTEMHKIKFVWYTLIQRKPIMLKHTSQITKHTSQITKQ
jgi:hypothetical protein